MKYWRVRFLLLPDKSLVDAKYSGDTKMIEIERFLQFIEGLNGIRRPVNQRMLFICRVSWSSNFFLALFQIWLLHYYKESLHLNIVMVFGRSFHGKFWTSLHVSGYLFQNKTRFPFKHIWAKRLYSLLQSCLLAQLFFLYLDWDLDLPVYDMLFFFAKLNCVL